MIFNTHSHICDRKDEEIEAILQNALENDVNKIAVVGYDKESSIKSLKLANKYDMLYAICGIQPEEVNNFDKDYSFLFECLNDKKCIALGEIGLDYYFTKENKDLQIEVFQKQLEIASTIKKPIQIHCRNAHEDLYNILEKWHKKLDGIILHCYSGSVEMMNRYLKLGCYISFSGVVTFKNAKEIKEVAKNCPIDRILVETDDPYLTPVPFRGTINQPSNVRYVIEEIAKIKDIPLETLKENVYANSLRVFHL